MTISILSDCLLLKDQSNEKMKEYFQMINVKVFDGLFAKFYNPNEAKQAILFILLAFSEESPLIIPRADARIEQLAICDYLQVPEYMQDKLVQLVDDDVRKAATDYIYQYASPLFRALQFLKIQLDHMILCVTQRNFATLKETQDLGDGNTQNVWNFDSKEFGKMQTEIIRVSREINKLEKEIMEDVKRRRSLQDVEDFKTGGRTTGSKIRSRSGNIESIIKPQ